MSAISIVFILLGLVFAPLALAQSTSETKKSAPQEEVRKPTPMTEQELKVIRNLSSLDSERLQELLTLYSKLDNEAMVQMLARQLLKRNPAHTEAQKALEHLSAVQTLRPANYTELLITLLDEGKPVEDPAAIAVESHRLAEDGQAREAVRVLEKLRRINYPSSSFPYLEDLASAYQDSGMHAAATQAYQQVLADPASNDDAREAAQRQLNEIQMEKRIQTITSRTKSAPERTLQEARQVLREKPSDPQALRFYLESLNATGHFQEALQKLQELSHKSSSSRFTYEDILADTYYGAGDFAKASAAYTAVQNNTNFDEATRSQAKKMLAEIASESQFAAARRSVASPNRHTEALLNELEQSNPNNAEVLTLKAQWLQKTGHSDEALRLLLAAKEKAKYGHQPFANQETLAGLYVAQKQYQLAEATYQEILSNPDSNSESKADATEQLRDLRQDQLINEGNQAIKDGHIGRAREIGTELYHLSPHDRSVRIYLAEVDLITGNQKNAYQSLTQLKAESDPQKPFPAQENLADAMNRLGQWQRASEAYQSLIDDPQSYEAADVFDAQLQQRNLQPYFKNSIKFDINFVHEEQGVGYHEEFVEVTPWWNQWRAILSLRDDQATLSHLPMLVPQHSDRAEGQIALQRSFGDGYFAEASAGGAEGNVLYGARIGRLAQEGTSWWLGYAGNARAADYSLPLDVLNARENRLQFSSSGEFNSRLRYDVNAFVHWISIDHQNFGTAYSASGNISYVLQSETPTKPELTIGYAGEYTEFHAAGQLPQSVVTQLNGQSVQVRRALAPSQELRAALPANYGSEIYNNLIAPEVNRQGIQLTIHKHLFHNFDLYAQGEIYYEFYLRSLNYTVECGVDYWINPSFRLFGELRYDSAGRGPASGQGVLEATLGAAATF